MKKKFLKVLSLILVFSVILGNTAFATSGDIDPEIIAETKEIAVQIESEGIVLLKNEDNFLPLENKKVNIFGAGSVCPFFGGAGSGAITTDDPVTLYEAFETEGIEYNPELRALYEKHCLSNELPKTDNTVINNLLQVLLAKNTLEEMNPKHLTDELFANAVEFSDTAIIVISRTSAEGTDHTVETLSLSDDEKAMVEKVTTAFENVVVLFNIGNVMEMGWIDEYESIKAAAIIWIPGEFGMTAVPQMLDGKVNPSGRLTDTISYKIEDHPSSVCFGSYEYNGGKNFVEYYEGIYVGYRYFETFAKDKVQYPFGYGLSYTSFEKEVVSTDFNEENITVNVKVANTGDRAGKEVVQLYYSAPYTEGGIEKSAICLGGFAKTDMLEPGESEILSISFKTDDMASYDYKVNEAWVLDEGTYKIIVANDVRNHIASYDYKIAETKVIKNDSATGTEIENLFADVYSGYEIMSRADVVATYPELRELDADDYLVDVDKVPEPTTEGEAPKMGVKYDKTITLQDVAEDESLWDAFLDQLTLDEMTMLVINGGYETHGVDRLGIPHTMDNDGPSSVKGRNGLVYTASGTAYPCATAIGCTWNAELAYEMGKGAGKEAKDMGTDTWYAPGANIHRNPRGGRNFEYFSEDPIISGIMAAQIINGANSESLVTTIKHFVLNDQESHRNGIFTWCDEQAMREIYLKAFEIPVKEAQPKGIMSAYNRIGTKWCGSSSALLKDLLREEWGFEGFVVSDYSSNFTGSGYMSPVLAVYNGNDTMLTGMWSLQVVQHKAAVKLAYAKDPVGFGNALREACKNLCIMKMETKAFKNPEVTYDSSLIGTLDTFDDWTFEFPYVFTFIRFVLNNIANIVIYAFRFIL